MPEQLPYALVVADLSEAPAPPVHVITQRSDFEQRVGMTYCRRCGRPVVNDRYPDKVTQHNCEVVKIDLRAIDQRIDALHGPGAAKAIEEAYPTHVHIWRETRVGCEDCGDHPALVCDGEGECPEMEGVSVPYLDLITYEDPR